MPMPRFHPENRRAVKVKGRPMARVISIIPAIVPTPKRNRYVMDHHGSWMVLMTKRAIAAEPARPWTMPTRSGRRRLSSR